MQIVGVGVVSVDGGMLVLNIKEVSDAGVAKKSRMRGIHMPSGSDNTAICSVVHVACIIW
jgi:hypothetical protein